MPSAPYDTLEVVLNTARTRLNDAIASLGGDIFTDTAVFTATVVNIGWRRFQEVLFNFGYQGLNRETILPSVPAVTKSDQSVQVYFNWSTYFDGTNSQAAPVLPQDMISPLELFERPTGSTGGFFTMDQQFNGLPTDPKGPLNKSWEWRNETIYMPGSTAPVDLRMRYAGYYADFPAPGGVLTTSTPVPVVRSLNSFAWFICAEVSRSRADMDSGYFDQMAMQATEYVFNRDERQAKSLFKGDELGKMTDRYTPTQGPQSPRGATGGLQ